MQTDKQTDFANQGDTISRQAAIDAVCMEWCGVKHQDCKHPFDAEKDDYYWCDGCETALRTLPDLPSAQPDQQWIPCSEPPTEHGFYHEILLCGKDGNYAVGWYDEDYFTWDDRFDLDTPIAWMPLPEPYKEKDNERA